MKLRSNTQFSQAFKSDNFFSALPCRQDQARSGQSVKSPHIFLITNGRNGDYGQATGEIRWFFLFRNKIFALNDKKNWYNVGKFLHS